MTRNLVMCMVPTILAFFAIYWLKRRKKTNSISKFSSNNLQEEEKSSLVCTSLSDLDNTLSDASSFTSPRISEKSSETESPLFDPPLYVIDGRGLCDLILPSCIDDSSIAYASEDKDLTGLPDPKQGFISESLNNSEMLKDNHNTNSQSEEFNGSFEYCDNNPENCFQKKVVVSSDNLATLISVIESEETNECHSSAYEENSLSFNSDDSDGKQPIECRHKGSLSSVLDENSLLSSFCDELEKSSASNSPIAVMANSNHFIDSGSDSPKDILDLLSFKESSINIQNYRDSYHSKVSDLDKLIQESSVEINNSHFTDQLESYQIIFKDKQVPFCCETFTESGKKDVDQSNLRSLISEESREITDNLNDRLVKNVSQIKESDDRMQNNLSNIVESSLALVDELTSISTTLNIGTGFENKIEQLSYSEFTEGSSDIAESGCRNIASFNGNKTSVNSATYASILSSNKNNSSMGASTSILQQISAEFTPSPTNSNVNELLKSNLNWPLNNNKSALKSNNESDFCSSSNHMFNVMKNEILPLKSEIKNNSISLTSDKNSTCLHQKNILLESSVEDGHVKDTKPYKIENKGLFDQKTSVSQSSKEYVYEFELPQELCGRLIGKHGRNVKSIMEQSNANVFIKHHPYDPLLKIVVVEGHRADVNEALEIIRRKYPPSLFPAVTLVQTNVQSSTGVPMPESLQLHLPEGASCDVILSSLVSAGHFFLQQPTHPTYPSLSTLDQCMINLYSQVDTPLLPQPIEAGVICAAPVYRGWYRAQVVYVCDNSSDCGIKFVDYGGFSQVTISSLRQIRSDFMSLPFQASECYLAQVRPLGGDTWSSEATSVFEELAQGQILQALLVEYADDGIPCVYLYRVQGVSSTFINKELVERGLAEWVSNSSHWDPH